MKKYRWQLLIILLAGILLGVLILTRPPDQISGDLSPQKGGTYSEGLVGGFQRLNPLFDHYNQPDRDVNRLLFNGLVKFDASGSPQPDLASAWGYSLDGLTYNFALREDVFWHDGQPFNVDDVIFTIEKMREEDSIIPSDLKSFWQEIKINRLNDFNLQFILPEPFSPFLDYLSFGILPRHLLEGKSFLEIQESSFNLQPVGTGPYLLDHLIVENNQITGVVLAANEKYFEGAPFIEEVTFKYYTTSEDMYNAYLEGEIQGLSRVTGDFLAEVLQDPQVAVYTGRRPELSVVLLNHNDPSAEFLQDVNVRQALMLGINRSVIVNQLLAGQAILADSPLFPGTWGYFSSSPIPFDPDLSISKLKEAKYLFTAESGNTRSKDGKLLTFTLLYPEDDIHRKIAEAIKTDWAKIGVDVKIQGLPYEELIDQKLVKRDFQAALVDLNMSRTPDPDPYPFWDQAQATGGQNYSQWDNRVASEYIEQARVINDIPERTRLYHNFQVVFREEMPALLLYYPVYTYAIRGDVNGVQMGPLYDPSDRLAGIRNWFLLVQRNIQNNP